MCGAHISLISNEFQLIIILIPLLGFIYNRYYRRALATVYTILGVCGSLIPVVWICLEHKVDSFPGFMSNGYSEIYTKFYFRIPPFLLGTALGIFSFEYKHVDKLNDGTKPFHKDFIQK